MESVYESHQKTNDSAITAVAQDCDIRTGLNPVQVREMFEAMLSGWAFDWLRLLSRGLDRPTYTGREIAADAEVIVVDEELMRGERAGTNFVNHIPQAQKGNGGRVRRFDP